MFLENIHLINFKNYEEADFTFSEGINSLVGKNGSGKTNLLDAIYYLCFTKSAFNAIDSQNIKHNEQFFAIRGSIVREGEINELVCSLKPGQKKRIRLNKRDLERNSDLIGRFPAVLIAPNDSSIITEGSDMRRKFFDGILSQLSGSYLRNLLQYNHALKQRNQTLKSFAERRVMDSDLLDTYDHILAETGTIIYQKRLEFLNTFTPLLNQHYAFISNDMEQVTCQYNSEMENRDFFMLLKENRQRDMMVQRTSKGIHRDDMVFNINGYPLKKFGSQGQQKSFLIALKLAQFDIIEQDSGVKPLLLLDDIFDKLDDDRIHKLLQLIDEAFFRQVFITDARPERTMQFLKQIESDKKIFDIEDGQIMRERLFSK